MSEEADRRIAKAVAEKKAANDAERIRLHKEAEQVKSQQERYRQAASKFRDDISIIHSLVTDKNKLLNDAGISLRSDGGKAKQGANQLELIIIAAKSAKDTYPRLVFTVAESGFEYQIQRHSRSFSARRHKTDVMRADEKYYEEAITSFIEAILGDSSTAD